MFSSYYSELLLATPLSPLSSPSLSSLTHFSSMEERWVSYFHPNKTHYSHFDPLLLFFFITTLVLLLSPTPSQSATPNGQNATDDSTPLYAAGDLASLLLFKSWLDDPYQTLSTWVGSNCTAWTGVACLPRSGRVTLLNLTSMSLSGYVHPSLCSLSLLQTLILSHNGFNGSIPSCFGNFRRLETLDLRRNRFSGEVPSAIHELEALRELVLRENQDLGGFLPVWIGNFSGKIEKIDLGFDSFHGKVPESLFISKSIKYVDFENNRLSGNLRDFDNPLLYLNLGSNQFSGTLPCFSASAQSLTVLNLANNAIVGGIPTCISSLRALSHLNLSSNRLNYDISPRFVFSDKLIVLDLSYNDFSGPLPTKIAEVTEKSGLVLLDLSHNRFSGEIPMKFTELKSLQAFFLSHNLLTGEIPARIGNLTYMQVIDLSHNLLSGSIPLNIVGCFQLLALILNNNNLSGEIQPELDALNSLKILDISNNKISGEIPLTLAGCKSLEIVDFSSNNLSGALNDAITKWENLRYLSLARNKFDGALPNWLFTFEAIQTMDLSGNKFTGFIPDFNYNVSLNFNNSISKQKELEVRLEKPEIRVSVVVVDSNDLSFTIDLSSTVGIDLSDNLLHGEIPIGLFGLRGLEYLNLSYNFLEGQIRSLEKMQGLRALDLSHNLLSGRIPENISTLRELTLLNLSYNCFSGFVSKKQGYWRFAGAFAGNPGLCVESSTGGCQVANLPVVPGKRFEGEIDNVGPISVLVFSISACVSFYFGLVALFYSTRARNYFLQIKA